MTKAELHVELVRLAPSSRGVHIRMIGHALIELGVVTELVCMKDHCRLSSRQFQVRDVNNPRGKGIISIDHIQEQSQGGSDLPLNLRFVHFACNASSLWSAERKLKVKNRKPWNTGQLGGTLTEEHKLKLRGRVPWNKGSHHGKGTPWSQARIDAEEQRKK